MAALPLPVPTNRRMQLIALAISFIIAVQLIIIAVTGDAACINEGCSIIESLTTVSPFSFNLVGLLYFLGLFASLRWCSGYRIQTFDWPRLVLLAGIAVEGVLIAFQIMVVQVICAYCLFIAAVVLILNFLAGWEHFLRAVSTLISVTAVFSMLSFGPPLALSRGESLTAGTYGSISCTEPAKELYLIFSENCPHCVAVIKALQRCNNCVLHFNPVSTVRNPDLPAVAKAKTFDPNINKLMLALLDIKAVPVLLVRNLDGFSFITGEKDIINYVEKVCIRPEPLSYMDSSSYIPEQEERISQPWQGRWGMRRCFRM